MTLTSSHCRLWRAGRPVASAGLQGSHTRNTMAWPLASSSHHFARGDPPPLVCLLVCPKCFRWLLRRTGLPSQSSDRSPRQSTGGTAGRRPAFPLCAVRRRELHFTTVHCTITARGRQHALGDASALGVSCKKGPAVLLQASLSSVALASLATWGPWLCRCACLLLPPSEARLCDRQRVGRWRCDRGASQPGQCMAIQITHHDYCGVFVSQATGAPASEPQTQRRPTADRPRRAAAATASGIHHRWGGGPGPTSASRLRVSSPSSPRPARRAARRAVCVVVVLFRSLAAKGGQRRCCCCGARQSCDVSVLVRVCVCVCVCLCV